MITDWETKSLAEVAYLAGRIGWKGLTAKEYTEEGPLFLSVHSLNYGDYVDFGDAFHISQERYEESPEIMLKTDDVLICKDGAGIGKVGIVGELPGEATINSSLLLIRAGEGVLPKYLYFSLLSPFFQRIVASRLQGATTPHLYQRDIKEFPISFPPLRDQNRIVAILDEAFEGIDTAIANAEKNLVNAKELYDSQQARVFSTRWPIKRLGDVCENLDSKRVPITKKNRVPGDIPYYGASGVVDHVADYIFNEDLLLVSEDGANLLARTYPIAFSVSGKTWVNNHAHVLRFEQLVTQRFVEYYLNSISLVDFVSGMAQPKLNQKSLNSIPVPLPDMHTQEQVVSLLDVIQNRKNRLIEIYKRKTGCLGELKDSALQKAFAGEFPKKVA